jgi:ketosteroid isomerase-like protein
MVAAIVIPATSSSAAGKSVKAHHPPKAAAIVAALDTEYQAAVKRNDAVTMSRLLADDFVLVVGSGATITKADLVNSARSKECTYEQQQEVAGSQTVRVFGHATAVATAQLWEKGSCTDGSKFDAHLWFSDTYVRSHGHWRYEFGQASRAL